MSTIAFRQVVRMAVLLRRAVPLAMLAACGSSSEPSVPAPVPAPVPSEPNLIQLRGEAGEFVSDGRNYDYTLRNSLIRVTATTNVITVTVVGNQEWTGNFAAPAGSALRVGTYTNATRYPLNAPTSPGLSWTGQGRVCNQSTGSFTIDSISVVNGTLTAVTLRFEQQCDAAPPLLRGTIRWRADDPTKPDWPIVPIPANLWTPDPSLIPASGAFVFFASDAGDLVGQGAVQLYAGLPRPFSITANGPLISLNGGPYRAQFYAGSSSTPIPVGYYPIQLRYPFNNPVFGGMDVVIGGRTCGSTTGWFVVDRATYVGTLLSELQLRFEQRCDGGSAALRGMIRWP